MTREVEVQVPNTGIHQTVSERVHVPGTGVWRTEPRQELLPGTGGWVERHVERQVPGTGITIEREIEELQPGTGVSRLVHEQVLVPGQYVRADPRTDVEGCESHRPPRRAAMRHRRGRNRRRGPGGPISQDPAYHAFADQREILGVPHFWNVVSNVPFALAGILGLVVLARRPRGMIAENSLAYVLFFAGAILIAVGSGYYHLNPTNETLLWDRLPMTISLMAFFDVVIGEHIGVRLARRAIVPLVAVGIASAAYWGLCGRGSASLRDRPVPAARAHSSHPDPLSIPAERGPVLWAVLACYAVAKVFELFDAPVHRALGVSGHTLKHVAAAVAMFVLALGLRSRTSPPELASPARVP